MIIMAGIRSRFLCICDTPIGGMFCLFLLILSLLGCSDGSYSKLVTSKAQLQKRLLRDLDFGWIGWVNEAVKVPQRRDIDSELRAIL
jgi:hypothetical protein